MKKTENSAFNSRIANIENQNYFIDSYIYLIYMYKQQLEFLQKYKPFFFQRKKTKKVEILKKEYERNIMSMYIKIEEELEAMNNINNHLNS